MHIRSDACSRDERVMTTGRVRSSVHVDASHTGSPAIKRRRDTLRSDFAPAPVCEAPAREPAVTEVFESEESLRPHPDCLGAHGKGKLNAIVPNGSDVDCGEHWKCREVNLDPRLEDNTDFRLTTGCPLEDIKRWLTTPNSTLFDGQRADRLVSWESLLWSMNSTTTQDVEKSIEFAIQQAMWRREAIESLYSYGRREPYFIEEGDVFYNAMDPYNMPLVSSLQHMSNKDLADWLCRMAAELDLLCKTEEDLVEEIVGVKWGLCVKWGEIHEIEQLLALGIVSEEQVIEYCGI